MKFSLEDFLNDELTIMEGEGDQKVEKQQLRIERITELVVRNRGTFEVTGWGDISGANPTDNPYGYYGINVNEAMEIIKTEGFILGFMDAAKKGDPDIKDEEWFQSEVFDKIEVQRNKDIQAKIKELEKIKEETKEDIKESSDVENSEIIEEIRNRAIIALNATMVQRIDVDTYLAEGRIFVSPEHLELTSDQIEVYKAAGYIDDYNGMLRFNVKKLKEEYERQKQSAGDESE